MVENIGFVVRSARPKVGDSGTQGSDSLRQRSKSGRLETTRKIMICDCLPIVGVLLV
jgi:hypothetical protein